MTKQEILKRIHELKELKTMFDELKTEIDGIEAQLKAEMDANGKEEMVVDIFKLRYTTVTQKRVDTTSLKKELPEIALRYTKESTYRRFQVA